MDDEVRGFVVDRISVPSVRVNCSGVLAGLRAEDYVAGEFVVNRLSVGPITVDCSKFGRDEERVELVVGGAADADALDDLLRAIGGDLLAGPGAARTERLPDGDTLAVLTLAAPAGGESAFTEVVRRARAELGKPGPDGLRLKRASIVFAA